MVSRIAAVIVSWVVVTGCSSSSTAGGGDGGAGSDGAAGDSGGLSATQGCTDSAHARCTLLQTCSATDVQLRYGSESVCETREAANCVAALGQPSNGNSAAAQEACAQAYAAWSCADFLDDRNIPTACAQQTGSLASGSACAVNGQCQSGFCATAPDAACGVCSGAPVAGASCAQLTSCGPGFTCTSDTSTCVVLAVQGGSCGKGAPCGAGLSCVGADATKGTPGACQPSGATAGAACDPTQKTAAACERAAGLVCNTQSKTCEAVVIASTGQPCGTDVGDQPAYCAAGGVCTGATATLAGTCTAAAADGAACDDTAGPSCVTPSRCIGAGDGSTSGTCETSGAQTCGG